jgi:iron complex outermembrane receptor protein
LTWVTGIYGLGTYQHNFAAFYEPYYAGTDFAFNAFNRLAQKLVSESAFGQVEYSFTPGWRGILGLRVTHDQKEFQSRTYYNELGSFVPGGGSTVYNPPLLIYDFSTATVGDLAKQIHTDWSGKAEVDRILSEHAMLYASVARGIKGAAFNSNGTGGTSIAGTPIRGEHMIAYEVGEKFETLHDRLRLNSSVFYYDYHDFQTYQTIITTSPYVTNNDARFGGGEIEIVARPISGLDVHLAVAGLTSRIYDVHTAQIGVVDQQAPDAPKWSSNGLIRYSWGVGAGIASVQWSADYVGQRYHSADNTPAELVPSSIGHNARIGYTLQNWDFSIYVNNVFDAARQTGRYDVTGTGGYFIATLMPPRLAGASVRYQL